MVFGLFKKKDPVCGMKQEKGKGLIDEKTGNWFCSSQCKEEFVKRSEMHEKSTGSHSGGCCH
jgi:YHS domain-containing protein